MSYENSAGIGVYNQYGPRNTGGSVGQDGTTYSSLIRLSIQLTGASLNSAYLPPVKLPKGAKLMSSVLRVDEAFALTGTTPAVSIGVAGSVGTNYISLSKAELEAIGTKPLAGAAGNGTWAVASTTGMTAAALVAKALTGTTPVVDATIGKATLVLEFINLATA